MAHKVDLLTLLRLKCSCGRAFDIDAEDRRLSSRAIYDLLLDRFLAHRESMKELGK